MDIKEILRKLINHEISVIEAEKIIKDIINGFRNRSAVELTVESVSFGAESNTGYLKLKIPYQYEKIKHLNLNDKVDVMKIF